MEELQYLHDNFDQKVSEQGRPVVILVEDDKSLGESVKKYLEKKLSLEVFHYVSPIACLEAIDTELSYHTKFCLITDISFDETNTDGLQLIDLLKKKNYLFEAIVMTGFASIETAISATKRGVFKYLTKPFDLETLSDLVLDIFCKKLGYADLLRDGKEAEREIAPNIITNQFKIEEPTSEDEFCGMIGRSKAMKKIFERIEKVAKTDSTVLITGPSGTGKELVARAIKTLSTRDNGPMVSVNCGAIPTELLESELFGHEKGAFTGAITERKGRFEVANNGTIFLDEIGDMPLLLQVKLLRVLQSRVIERVGSTNHIDINVRIITATHRDLEKAVLEGDFREDLFYRLNVIPVKIPSLAQRREDIPLLISYFLSRFVSADGRNKITFDDDTLELLMSYNWPGNVRELENLIERLVILKGGGVIKLSDLPAKFLEHNPSKAQQYDSLINLPESGIDLKQTLSNIEDSLILQALEKTKGNKNQASKLLFMNRTTLIEKMKKKGLIKNDFN